MIEMSKYFGEKTEATVYKDEKGFFATVKNSFGVYYTTRFDLEEDAEDFAEDWVNKDE